MSSSDICALETKISELTSDVSKLNASLSQCSQDLECSAKTLQNQSVQFGHERDNWQESFSTSTMAILEKENSRLMHQNRRLISDNSALLNSYSKFLTKCSTHIGHVIDNSKCTSRSAVMSVYNSATTIDDMCMDTCEWLNHNWQS